MKKSLYLGAYLFALLFSIGLLFKLMHWPMANILIVTSMAVLNLLVLPVWLMDQMRRA